MSDSTIILEPFKVAVFDDYFNPCLVQAACEDWPTLDWVGWHKHSDGRAAKYASVVARGLPASCLALLDEMSVLPLTTLCPYFYQPGCFPDMGEYHAGGLHMFVPGGVLDCHVDGTDHPTKPWQRIVNLVLCVTPWKAEWGGQFNLHDKSTHIVNSIQPKFNRLVVFQPTTTARHSVSPVSLSCPHPRKNLVTSLWKQVESKNLNTVAKFD